MVNEYLNEIQSVTGCSIVPLRLAAASMAAVWLNKDDPDVQAYLGDMDNMHKIICMADSLDAITTTADALAKAGVAHKVWVEQPEAIVTCVATKPGRRKDLLEFFKPFKLLR